MPRPGALTWTAAGTHGCPTHGFRAAPSGGDGPPRRPAAPVRAAAEASEATGNAIASLACPLRAIASIRLHTHGARGYTS